MDAAVESFLALSTARLAPRTVDAYRRDLSSFATWLGASPARATPEELAGYVAQLRADGLAATSRSSAAGSSGGRQPSRRSTYGC